MMRTYIRRCKGFHLFFTLVVICSLCIHNANAQQNTIFRAKAIGHYGMMIDNDKDNGFNPYGGEIGMELPLFGNHNWEYTYNFPSVGFTMGYLRIADPEYNRHVIPVITYFHWSVVHTNMFALNLKWGSGLAGQILDKTDEHDYNDYFPVTGVLDLGLNMDFQLSKKFGKPAAQWIITIGADAQFYNNCNITRRRKNAVLATANIGLKYTPNVWPLPIKYPAKSVKHTLALEAYGAGCVNQLEREDKTYANADVNVGVFVPISNAYRLGLAADAFYNGAYDGTQRTENIRYNFIEENRFINKFRVGVALANEITMGRANVGIHAGIYCLNKVRVPKYDENGSPNDNRIENFMYMKLVTRFYFTPKFFIVADVKTHLNKVECINVGLGWAMPDFGSHLKNPFARISFKKEDKEELRITGSEK